MNDRTLARQVYKHLAFGYTDPAMTMDSLEALQEAPAGLSPEQQKRRIDFSVGLLRQALLIIPFYQNLREQLTSINATMPPHPLYAGWFAATGVILSRLGLTSCLDELRRAHDASGGAAELSSCLQKETNPVAYFAYMLRLWETGSWEHFGPALENWLKQPAGPLAADLFAQAALTAGDMDMAERCLAVAVDGPLASLVRGNLARRAGDRDLARSCYLKSFAALPAQLFIPRLIAALDRPDPAPGLADKYQVGIGFYTWNKFQITLDTLASLLASNIGQAKVVLINNGSDQFSPEEFEAAVRRTAQGYPVELIHLPVNIGAPAARNWIWALESMREMDFLAYLDDDVLLPSNWLACYLQDLEECPEAVVAGPKGLNYGSLPGIQYIPRMLDRAGPDGIGFTHNAPLIMDLGQFDYCRPSLSVMGCCHLFNRRRCRDIDLPGFDLRFSPSQVDDIEHDLQIWKHGATVLFDGRVGVIHRQATGRAAQENQADWGHVLGNHYKMERKLAKDIQTIETRMYRAEAADLAAMLNNMSGVLDPTASAYAAMCLAAMNEF